MFYAGLTPCHYTCITFPTRAGKKNHIQISNVHFYMCTRIEKLSKHGAKVSKPVCCTMLEWWQNTLREADC